MRRGVGRNVSAGGYARTERVDYDRGEFPNRVQEARDRELIARFFADLRRALRLTLPQAAYQMRVHPDVIEALETGRIEYLPPWPQTAQIVMDYTAMASIDGRPVLNALGAFIASIHVPSAPPVQRQVAYAPQASGHFVRAGSAIANGARRLPKDAMHQIRERPQRALYALSVPLLLLLFFHASIFDLIARPFSSAVTYASVYFQEHFAPVRDGFRWIEVNDPRSRRGDKLRIAGGSY